MARRPLRDQKQQMRPLLASGGYQMEQHDSEFESMVSPIDFQGGESKSFFSEGSAVSKQQQQQRDQTSVAPAASGSNRRHTSGPLEATRHSVSTAAGNQSQQGSRTNSPSSPSSPTVGQANSALRDFQLSLNQSRDNLRQMLVAVDGAVSVSATKSSLSPLSSPAVGSLSSFPSVTSTAGSASSVAANTSSNSLASRAGLDRVRQQQQQQQQQQQPQMHEQRIDQQLSTLASVSSTISSSLSSAAAGGSGDVGEAGQQAKMKASWSAMMTESKIKRPHAPVQIVSRSSSSPISSSSTSATNEAGIVAKSGTTAINIPQPSERTPGSLGYRRSRSYNNMSKGVVGDGEHDADDDFNPRQQAFANSNASAIGAHNKNRSTSYDQGVGLVDRQHHQNYPLMSQQLPESLQQQQVGAGLYKVPPKIQRFNSFDTTSSQPSTSNATNAFPAAAAAPAAEGASKSGSRLSLAAAAAAEAIHPNASSSDHAAGNATSAFKNTFSPLGGIFERQAGDGRLTLSSSPSSSSSSGPPFQPSSSISSLTSVKESAAVRRDHAEIIEEANSPPKPPPRRVFLNQESSQAYTSSVSNLDLSNAREALSYHHHQQQQYAAKPSHHSSPAPPTIAAATARSGTAFGEETVMEEFPMLASSIGPATSYSSFSSASHSTAPAGSSHAHVAKVSIQPFQQQTAEITTTMPNEASYQRGDASSREGSFSQDSEKSFSRKSSASMGSRRESLGEFPPLPTRIDIPAMQRRFMKLNSEDQAPHTSSVVRSPDRVNSPLLSSSGVSFGSISQPVSAFGSAMAGSSNAANYASGAVAVVGSPHSESDGFLHTHLNYNHNSNNNNTGNNIKEETVKESVHFKKQKSRMSMVDAKALRASVFMDAGPVPPLPTGAEAASVASSATAAATTGLTLASALSSGSTSSSSSASSSSSSSSSWQTAGAIKRPVSPIKTGSQLNISPTMININCATPQGSLSSPTHTYSAAALSSTPLTPTLATPMLYSFAGVAPPATPSTSTMPPMMMGGSVPSERAAVAPFDNSRANVRAPSFDFFSEVHHKGSIRVASLAGSILVTAFGSIRIWDLHSGENVRTVSMGDRKVTALMFRPTWVVEKSISSSSNSSVMTSPSLSMSASPSHVRPLSSSLSSSFGASTLSSSTTTTNTTASAGNTASESPSLKPNDFSISPGVNTGGVIHAKVAGEWSQAMPGTSGTSGTSGTGAVSSSLYLQPPPPLPSGGLPLPALHDLRPYAVPSIEGEGRFVWAGLDNGGMVEIDVLAGEVVARRQAHSQAVVAIVCSEQGEIWSVDEAGTALYWTATDSLRLEMATKKQRKTIARPTCVLCSPAGALWSCSGKVMEVQDSWMGNQAPPIFRMDVSGIAGTFTSLAWVHDTPEGAAVCSAHDDGKIVVWDAGTGVRRRVLSVGFYRINSLVGVGRMGGLWVGFGTGKILVLDPFKDWAVVKEWQANEGSIDLLVLDVLARIEPERLNVASISANGTAIIWDGVFSQDWINEELRKRQPEFCNYRDISMLVCSWNLNACKPSDLIPTAVSFLENWLSTANEPDIIVVGFQEIIDLDSKKQARVILKSTKRSKNKDDSVVMLWQAELMQAILKRHRSKYRVLVTKQLVGLFVILFVNESIAGAVHEIGVDTVKTGLGGLHGNKGGILLRFLIDDTSFCVVTCHLPAGQSQTSARHTDLATVLKNASFQRLFSSDSVARGGDGSKPLDHEYLFVFGDLNYRIDLPRERVLELIQSNDLQSLRDKDQLMAAFRNRHSLLSTFVEGPIQFLPTYKYDLGCDVYDTSEKARVPAWCDRILCRADVYSSNGEYLLDKGGLLPTVYRRLEVQLSDHRPIVASYKVQIKKVDPGRRAAVLAQVHGQWAEQEQERIRRIKTDWLAARFELDDYGGARKQEKAVSILHQAGWELSLVPQKR